MKTKKNLAIIMCSFIVLIAISLVCIMTTMKANADSNETQANPSDTEVILKLGNKSFLQEYTLNYDLDWHKDELHEMGVAFKSEPTYVIKDYLGGKTLKSISYKCKMDEVDIDSRSTLTITLYSSDGYWREIVYFGYFEGGVEKHTTENIYLNGQKLNNGEEGQLDLGATHVSTIAQDDDPGYFLIRGNIKYDKSLQPAANSKVLYFSLDGLFENIYANTDENGYFEMSIPISCVPGSIYAFNGKYVSRNDIIDEAVNTEKKKDILFPAPIICYGDEAVSNFMLENNTYLHGQLLSRICLFLNPMIAPLDDFPPSEFTIKEGGVLETIMSEPQTEAVLTSSYVPQIKEGFAFDRWNYNGSDYFVGDTISLTAGTVNELHMTSVSTGGGDTPSEETIITEAYPATSDNFNGVVSLLVIVAITSTCYLVFRKK